MVRRKIPHTSRLSVEEILRRAQIHSQAARTLQSAAQGQPMHSRTVRQVANEYRHARRLYMRLLRHPYYAERLTEAQHAEYYAAVKVIDEVLIGLS